MKLITKAIENQIKKYPLYSQDGLGENAKVIVKFFGREMAHTENGTALLAKFAESCEETGVIEKPAKLDGRNMIMILAPKKQANQSKGR